ncbi:thiamine pyrophosphate-dependent dehydrogenase E1 component subunit alpha [Pseudonocardia spinosispora]|uniref:thiamine pyrophosphate-dependent dehydrogenase E1 component subunit alpha n=1 Tax=Pseudonocardia spinosispora TaxID=103441 RepID=UPI000683EBE4|nr:thiamine pyrophosphate-dependent dehydrogenase E1 component subunit alpha [Pseudonocardia spinosispora]
MLRIRAFETRAERLFLDGEIPGFAHLSIGQEAVAAGVCEPLRTTDYITSTHRGHGHTLAKGAPVPNMMAELLGRSDGVCRGRGGSMHIADFSVGMLGANAIVAGGLGLATGAALSARLTDRDDVAVSFFGDGATARGPFHEALNLAVVWELPVVFVCENNGWASTTRSSEALAVPRITDRASAYRIASRGVDGNDVFAVHDAALWAVEHARRGAGPVLLECVTYRMRGHYIGDATKYRERAELAEWEERDPIPRAVTEVIKAGVADPATCERMRRDAEVEIENAVEFARASAPPDVAELARYLYSERLPADSWSE